MIKLKLNKIFIFSLIILAILAIGAVSASDNVTSDDLSIGLDDSIVLESSIEDIVSIDDDFSDTNADEEIICAEEDVNLSSEDKGAVGVDDNDINTIMSREIINNESVLTGSNVDKEILSDGKVGTVKVNIYKQTGKYLDKKIYLKITDAKTGKPVDIEMALMDVITYDYKTNKILDCEYGSFAEYKGNGIYVLQWSGVFNDDWVYKIKVAEIQSFYYEKYAIHSSSKNTVKVTTHLKKVKIKANKLISHYNSKKKFNIKVIGQDKKPVKDVCLEFKININGKYKKCIFVTNSKGIATYNKVSKLNGGKHKIKIKLIQMKDLDGQIYYGGVSAKGINSCIIILGQSVIIKPVELSTSFHSGRYFKAKIVDLKTKKPVKRVKVILKVFTGKKSKRVILTSNSKGFVKYSSSKLSVGKHKIILKVKKSKYFKGKTKISSINII